MKKTALFVFNDDPTCFIHVLLNAMDMKERGQFAKIIIEGAAAKLIPELAQDDNPLHILWEKTKSEGFIDGVCRACSHKMGTLESAKKQGLPILDEMAGHPSMARYVDEGYSITTF